MSLAVNVSYRDVYFWIDDTDLSKQEILSYSRSRGAFAGVFPRRLYPPNR